MKFRTRMLLLTLIGVLVISGTTIYGVLAFSDYQQRSSAPSEVETTSALLHLQDKPHILFRNTAMGQGYGLVAIVPLDSPRGPRSITEIACDRVAAAASTVSCLASTRGIATTFSATLFDDALQPVQSWPLPGLPSRTRVSPDGSLVATTAFVTGHAYATIGFSTQTTIHSVDGYDSGDLEEFTTTVDGQPLISTDRNIWGVTFSTDNNTFYATAASADRTWLMLGDLTEQTLVAVADTAECPSLSPNGKRIAYKKNVSSSATAYWSIAVRDLDTGIEHLLPEQRNVDDQVEWLDNDSLLFGMPRTDTVGDYDVWSIVADGASNAELFIEHAWSPTVVR